MAKAKVISMDLIKELRDKTSAGVMDAKRALEECNGDMGKAVDWIREKGIQRAEKKADREAKQGLIASYVHQGSQVVALVELNCETDFVARTDAFIKLGKELAMQVASMKPATVDELLAQQYIRDAKLTVRDLVKSTAGTVGENIVVTRLMRMAVGETAEQAA
ncbi:MAG TPA: translation elongation factor Ts [Patescibacteria group bacterium]|nr:translation elongation factor Ts [Patescibacteria group bacterium]